ncbi:MAG: NifU family protein [Wigglesworthia glossinidia]|nr:NifU family protein [Wigglesworthia glossinidia]
MLRITEEAQTYFENLLLNKTQKTHIKLIILSPKTKNIKCQIEYYKPKNNQNSDEEKKFKFSKFNVYINKKSLINIKFIHIKLKQNTLNNQIIIKIEEKKINLKKKLSIFIESKINKYLMQHGGHLELIELTKDMFVLIKFFGGCNGCSMVNMTLKDGIEKEIKKFFPEIKGVKDVTEHVRNSDSYY